MQKIINYIKENAIVVALAALAIFAIFKLYKK